MGCTTSPGVPKNSQVEHAAEQLQRQSDADSLAAAALLSVTKDRAQALALLAHAEAAAPTRPEFVWLYIQMCREETSCDPKPEEFKLRALSPGNSAGWLGELARADTGRDDAARDAALTAMAHTQRLDIYWTTLVGHLSSAVARTGKMPPAEAMLIVTGMMAAVAIPSYAPAVNSCKGDRLRQPDILESCQGVAAALENGDTVITEMLGVTIAKRVWPEGSAPWQAAVERRRAYDYQSQLWQSLQPTTWSAAQAQTYVTLCLERPREQDVLRAQLIDVGKDPDPPPI